MSHQKTSFQKHLLTLVKKVAQEEGFEIKPLEEKYRHCYVFSTKNGHRCVDGRMVLEKYGDGRPTGYKNEDYRGDQFPGGSLGILGATRVVTGLGETKAREVVKKACEHQGLRMGDHIDDAHGKIRTKEELEKRTQGCGNQDAAAQGKIPMYAGLVDRAIVDDRFAWLKSNGGAVPVLTGEHKEKLAAVNLQKGKTFNTPEAVKNNDSIFNLDLAAAYELGGFIFDQLTASSFSHQGPIEKEDFQDAIAKEVTRDYMQTLVALGGKKSLFIHH